MTLLMLGALVGLSPSAPSAMPHMIHAYVPVYVVRSCCYRNLRRPRPIWSTQSDTERTPGRRSRRGKYPVVELWRKGRDQVAEAWVGVEESRVAEEWDQGFSTRQEHLPAVSALALLEGLGFAREKTDEMLESFPALAHIHPDKLDIGPKLLFVRNTMGGDVTTLSDYPQFFGHPLERHIAPRHAFLVSSGQSAGMRLLGGRCQGLRKMLDLPVNRFVAEMTPNRTVSEFRLFEQHFLRGPFDAARRGDAEVLRLLRSHGWDCQETDRRGRTALHWAAGAGAAEACEALTEGVDGVGVADVGEDGSTPLHWAAAGVEAKRFGTGGHPDVCRWFLSQGADIAAITAEGNTVAMWAAWAGGLEVTRWAVDEANAPINSVNINGCSIAHWAASGGNETVCRYLASRGVDFRLQNKGGNDPLNHAVAYGRDKVTAWLLSDPSIGVRRRRDDPVLLSLARLTGDVRMEGFLLGDTIAGHNA